MFGIGTNELLIIFLIVLLLFGANRIPEIGRALGRGIRDFKRATTDIERDINLEADEKPRINRTPSGDTATRSETKEKTT